MPEGLDDETISESYSHGVDFQAHGHNTGQATGLLRGLLAENAIYARFNPELKDPDVKMDTTDRGDLKNLEESAASFLKKKEVAELMARLKPILLGERHRAS